MKRLIALALLLSACEAATPPQEPTGSTKFRLTDAPFPYDRVASVDIHVVRVDASMGPDTSSSAAGAFTTVANVNRKINLLALEGGLTDELGSRDLDVGAIKAIRLIIDTDKSSITMKDGSVLTGSSNPGIAWQSSAGIATLNATVEDHIFISDTGVTVVIDFDVGRAFIDPADVSPPSSHQGFIFSPVLRATQAGRTGSVSGAVRLAGAAGTGVNDATVQLKLGNPNNPENTWATVATARSDANGVFKFAFVTRSSFYTQAGWTYMVVASKAGARAVVTNVLVSAGADTPVGTVILPPS